MKAWASIEQSTMSDQKRTFVILTVMVIGIVLAIGGGTAAVLMTQPGAHAAAGRIAHHGMSPALWGAIFVAIYMPLLAGAARRKRLRKAAGAGGPTVT